MVLFATVIAGRDAIASGSLTAISQTSVHGGEMEIRQATLADAEGMSLVLKDIIALTGSERPSDPGFVASNYIVNPAGIRCSVALDDVGDILGFQSLIRALADNRYGAPEGWGIIGTHISPRAHRKGVGRSLFSSSKEAASQSGIKTIDAAIGITNHTALRYYEALGFSTYREHDGLIHKAFAVEACDRP